MDKEYLICIRCLTINKPSELLESKKLKRVSEEFSKRFKTCKNCKCRTFY